MNTFAGRSAGSFGALGGEISFEWVPDPNVLAAEIMKLAGYLENFIPPLESSKEIARADIQNHFDTESSPDGAAWAQLSDSYVNKRGSAHPILQLTGAMHDVATSDEFFMIDAHDLFIVTSGLPAYWIFHETGTEHAFMKQFAETMGEALVERAAEKMPARPFVGISFEAQLQIIEVFDAWFAGGVAGFYTRPSGRVQTIIRTPEGGTAFGPMLAGG